VSQRPSPQPTGGIMSQDVSRVTIVGGYGRTGTEELCLRNFRKLSPINETEGVPVSGEAVEVQESTGNQKSTMLSGVAFKSVAGCQRDGLTGVSRSEVLEVHS
jgi:hypothetical protein